jgi:hypothetical protein
LQWQVEDFHGSPWASIRSQRGVTHSVGLELQV